MKVTLFASTDVGQVRDHNEDNFAVCKDLDNKIWSFKKGEQVDLSAKGVVLVVADGMGGTNAGEVASDIAQKQIKEQFDSLENIPDKDKEKLKFIENAILAAHQKIVNHQEFNPSTAGMGTTIVVAWIINEKLYVGWVGDSRCYIFKKSQAMVPFTDDHSLVWGLVKEGKLTSEEARIHETSNIITNSLGDRANPPKPESKMVGLYDQDRIFLCSDGLNGELSDEEMEQIMRKNLVAHETCRELISRANEKGGNDNITIVMADITSINGLPQDVFPGRVEVNNMKKVLIPVMIILLTAIAFWLFWPDSAPSEEVKKEIVPGKYDTLKSQGILEFERPEVPVRDNENVDDENNNEKEGINVPNEVRNGEVPPVENEQEGDSLKGKTIEKQAVDTALIPISSTPDAIDNVPPISKGRGDDNNNEIRPDIQAEEGVEELSTPPKEGVDDKKTISVDTNKVINDN